MDGEESVYCLNCDQQSNKNFRESIGSIEFSENDFENSVQLKIDGMTNPCAETMDKPFKCEPCQFSKPEGTAATQTDSNEYQEISDPAIENIWL